MQPSDLPQFPIPDAVLTKLATLRTRVAELEAVRVTLATPPDVDDGVVTLTIAEADRAYGKGEWFGWAFDAADYYEEQRFGSKYYDLASKLERRVAELEDANATLRDRVAEREEANATLLSRIAELEDDA